MGFSLKEKSPVVVSFMLGVLTIPFDLSIVFFQKNLTIF